MKLAQNQINNLRSVPYYSEKLERTADCDSIDEITKYDFQAHNPLEFKNTSIEQCIRYAESSGTSGTKSYGWYCTDDIRRMATQITDKGVLLNNRDVVLVRFPYALCLPAFLIESASREVGAVIVPLSGRTEISPYFKAIDTLKELNVTILACNPREAELLYEAIDIQGLSISQHFPSLRAVVVAGEVMSPARKAYLERIWGVPFYNLYGATELGNFAYTCSEGHLHFDQTNYMAECRQPDGAFSEMPVGQPSIAYITALSNKAGPHIRFEIGDILEFSEKKCECGDSDCLVTCYGRQCDNSIVAQTDYSLYELQEIIYSLPVIPFGWKLSLGDEAKLELEFNARAFPDSEEIKTQLYTAFGCDESQLEVLIYSDFDLINRSDIYRYTTSKKPQYIFSKDEVYIDTTIEKGKGLLNAGDFKNAEKTFSEIVKFAPQIAEGHLWLAATVGLKADKATFIEKMALFPKLYRSTTRVLELDKYSPFGNYLMGIMLMKTPEDVGGDKVKAYRHLCLSKYLGYEADDLGDKINTLIELIF